MKNVTRALKIINAIPGFALGEKRITISTIGYPQQIIKLSRSKLKFGLAVSLNATTNNTRKIIMPESEDIYQTLAAAERFATGRSGRVTLEYVLLKGINDTPSDARRLNDLTAGKPFKINLIPFNEWPGCEFKKPNESSINRFIRILLPFAPAVTLRRSKGSDIDAACGQLAVKRRNNYH
jgi:23S rRNA (adenine2503-C2)-methyltransferase